ncbi:MAG TPA: hypothetical protein VHD63_18685 [Ktedonobacteraceae bacterium]|nr:hypothetical protein [Ktedonobacteraceae bacterium]
MATEETKKAAGNWYTRLNGWNNHVIARLLNWLALGLDGLARAGRGGVRTRMEGAARFCRNLARYIVQPATLSLMASPDLLKRALLESVGLTMLLTLAVVWTLLSVYGYLTIAVVPVTLLVVVLCLVFTHLIYLLALSSDIYQPHEDEAQRLFARQASSMTLRVVGWLLIALCLGLALLPGWRTWVAIDLGILILLARMLYLARLAHLRWSAFALLDLLEEASERQPLAEEQ